MRNFYYSLTLFVLVFGMALSDNAYATSDVYLSGSTWIAETNGSQVYSGGSFFDAVNAACWNEGSGTINIWNSGNSGPGGSNIYAIRPESNQTLDFHGNNIHCNGNDLVVAIRADGKSNITIKDVNVTGWPRYGFWFTGCNDVTFTDITMDITSGLGIRYSGRDSYASNLTINGTIDIHSVGHAIETYTVDGISIGTVTVRSDNGCGVLLNDSENAVIDAIYAYDCNYGGSYAGFRQANANGTTWLGYLYARRCGRGFYSVSGSNNCTVEEVDIADCSTSGASVSNSSHDVYINSGTITNSNKDVDIWNEAWNVCIQVNGGSFGDNCGSSGCSPTSITPYVQVNGGSWQETSSVTVNSGDEVKFGPQPVSGGSWSWSGCGTSGSSREQTIYPTGSCTATATYWNDCGAESTQHFNITVSGSGSGGGSYYKLSNRGTGQYLDGMGRTTNGDACGQWSSSSSQNQQWELENVEGNYYKLRNRATGLYLDGMGRTTNGDACGQWSGGSSHNQQWEQISTSGYYQFRNRATGLYLDGMGRTGNGDDVGQYANTSHVNAQWALEGVQNAAIVEGNATVTNKLNIYPNPSPDGQFTLDLSEVEVTDKINVEIYSYDGSKMFEQEYYDETQISIDISLDKGIYQVVVKNNDQTLSKKLAVQ